MNTSTSIRIPLGCLLDPMIGGTSPEEFLRRSGIEIVEKVIAR